MNHVDVPTPNFFTCDCFKNPNDVSSFRSVLTIVVKTKVQYKLENQLNDMI